MEQPTKWTNMLEVSQDSQNMISRGARIVKKDVYFNQVKKSPLERKEKAKMEMKNNKRLRPNEILTKNIIQWKIFLPEDIWDYVFLNYCDFNSILTTRMLQSNHVKRCTEGNDFKGAIEANNLNNLKWIYQCGEVKLNENYFNEATELGTLSIIKWLREKGCKWSCLTFACAAR